jgi:hypothetical protein
MKEEIIVHEGRKPKVIAVIDDVKSQEEIFYEQYSDKKYCLEAVKQDGYALRYVKDQTKEICLEAVKQDGDALRYVKDQTKEICLEAVKQDGYALRYVKDQITFKECLKVIKK